MLEWTDEQSRKLFQEALSSCYSEGGIRNLEIDCVDLSGNITPIELNATVVETRDGIQIMALCLDITERNQARELMIQSEKMVALAGLATGMAHEINNPLAGILQNTQVVLKRTTTDLALNHTVARGLGVRLDDIRHYMEKRDIVQQLKTIREAGIRAARIVENMLCFSRQGQGHFAPHRLDETLDRAVEIMARDYSGSTRDCFSSITIVRVYDSNLPPVMCEVSTIQQVFLNILSNGAEAMASQYTISKDGKGQACEEPPQFVLRTSLEGSMAVVSIQDNGPGMKEEDCKRAFEPFFTTKELGFGTGLGLSLSHFIITRNHKGTLEVNSSPGQGTVFTIGIPMAEH